MALSAHERFRGPGNVAHLTDIKTDIKTETIVRAEADPQCEPQMRVGS
jgi:hypothetical protein